MQIYRKINGQTIKIVLHWEGEVHWGEEGCVSWKATLPNGKELTSGITCDGYDSLAKAIPEIETMAEISMDIITRGDYESGDYEYSIAFPNVAFRGDRLRQLRHVRNIPASQVAHIADITTYHVYRLERGERPRVWGVTVAKLALALGTSTDYLLGITDDPAPTKPLE